MNKEDRKEIEEMFVEFRVSIETMVDEKINTLKESLKEEIEGSLPNVKDVKKILSLVEEKIAEFQKKGGNGGTPKVVKLIPNPDFDPEGKYENEDTVILKPTAENVHHADMKTFEAKGHQATLLIRKGMATFVEIKPKPKVTTKK